jgi:phosphoribosylformylglycinamidine (FGAM) synthase-like enzyme
MPDDAGVIRVDEESGLGVAIATDCNGRFAALDPYAGAQLALAESYRNVGVAGGRPLAVTDCLNFGSPEDPGVMWQFAEAVRGLADGCQILGIPVTGGNVSLYNQTGDTPIHPTPVVGVLGVMQDVAKRTPSGWRAAGAQLFLLGTTRPEFGGSEWAWAEHAHLGGLPPAVDLEAERSLADLLVTAGSDGLLLAAHDLSDGGLAQALVESSLRYGVGASVSLDAACARDGIDLFTLLFSESTARVLVAVGPESMQEFTQRCERDGVPVIALGASGGDAVTVSGRFSLALEELRSVHSATLPAVLNR